MIVTHSLRRYVHAHAYGRPCASCGSRDHRHAGYFASGLGRYWACIKCGETTKRIAEHVEVVDDDGEGHIRPI